MHNIIFVWTVAVCGCLNLDLLAEMVSLDTETDGALFSDGGIPWAGTGNPGGGTADGTPPPLDAEDRLPPEILLNCLPFEVSDGPVCVSAGVQTALIRFDTDEPAAVMIEDCPGHCELWSGEWTLGHQLLAYGYGSDETQLRLLVEDVNGNGVHVEIPLPAVEGYPVAITEVMADPVGPEPRQEFVEIVNYGTVRVDLSGWMIDDNGDYNGERLPPGTFLDGGEIAVLAMEGFEPPVPGVRIISTKSSIGTNGLKNSESESVELWDAEGELVTYFDAPSLRPREGISIVRLHPALPPQVPDAWRYDPGGGSSPGW